MDFESLLTEALSGIDLSSRQANKFDEARHRLESALGIRGLSIKAVGAPKNFGNRISEATGAGASALILVGDSAVSPSGIQRAYLSRAVERIPTLLVVCTSESFVPKLILAVGAHPFPDDIPLARVEDVGPTVRGDPDELLSELVALNGTHSADLDRHLSALERRHGALLLVKRVGDAKNLLNRVREALGHRPAVLAVVGTPALRDRLRQATRDALSHVGTPVLITDDGSAVWVETLQTELQGGPDSMRNSNVVDLLGYRVEGPNSVASANRGVSADRLAHLRITTGLDAPELRDSIVTRKHRAVLVLGTPGDGKSAFLYDFDRKSDGEGIPFAVRHDATHASTRQLDAEFNETVAFLRDHHMHRPDFPWEVERAPVVLLGVNRGLLARLLDSEEFRWLAQPAAALQVLSLDLAGRFPFGLLAPRDLFGDLLRAVVDRRYWEDWSSPADKASGCGACRLQDRCPILWNVRFLRRPNTVERLRNDLTRVVLSRTRRATMRDLWDYLSFIIGVHPDAYLVDDERQHPCDYLQEVWAPQLDQGGPGRQLEVLWRLTPSLAWASHAGSTHDDGSIEASDPWLWMQGTGRSGLKKLGSLSGLARRLAKPLHGPRIGSPLADAMRANDPDRSSLPVRRTAEYRASIDPAGLLDDLARLDPEGTRLLKDLGADVIGLLAMLEADEQTGPDDTQEAGRRVFVPIVSFAVRSNRLDDPKPDDTIRAFCVLSAEERLDEQEVLQRLANTYFEGQLPIAWNHAKEASRDRWQQLLRLAERSEGLASSSNELKVYLRRAAERAGSAGGEGGLVHIGFTGDPTVVSYDRPIIAGLSGKDWVDTMSVWLALQWKVQSQGANVIDVPLTLPLLEEIISVMEGDLDPGWTGRPPSTALEMFKDRLRSIAAADAIVATDANGRRFRISLRTMYGQTRVVAKLEVRP